MESIGRITEIRDGTAIVEIRRTSACEGCHKNAEGGCSVCTMLGGEKSRTMRASVRNPLGAEIGDTVRIESPTDRTLLWAALVFLLPLAMTAAGFAIACAISRNAVVRAVGAGAGFVLCFAGLRIASGILGKREPSATVTEIIERHQKENAPD